MTSFLQWRTMTWVVLWGGYVMLWMVTAGSGVTIAILWWLTGVVVFGSLRLATRTPFRRGRSIGGVLVRPVWTDRRFLDLRRTRRPGAQRGLTPGSRSDVLQPPEHR